ncbi:hypothetical protein HO133_002337 [Letharia lupina]|uniref:Uncharacterized protein n=1 Tax=Letharia lupina TaxID=560253 RepID=A0A8H6FB04_9LECA|nr:uncharacterized protein HO133_002337 [Letharia lupina]KAF6221481.1 hypothetical protein HO133_002337 [Letharia lupina]
MTDPGALSSWNPTEGIFSLNDEAPKPRPRAWERAPKSPVLARHHGRKVWKRHEAPAKPETKEESQDAEQTRQALGDTTNTPRPVKRLRLKDVPKIENNGKENKAAQYLTTLRDKESAGTPRRKQASKKSLKPDNARVKTQSADGITPMIVDNSKDAVQDDTLLARESPALEDVRELLSSGDDAADAVEIADTIPPSHSVKLPKDEIVLETECGTSSETITNTDQGASTDEVSLENGAVTVSETAIIAGKAIETDNDVASTQAVSEDTDGILISCDATSAAKIIVLSPSRHEETVNAEGAMTVDSGSALSPNANHSSSIPEALSIDIADASSSTVMDSLKTLTKGALIFEQPNLDSSLTPSVCSRTPKRASPRKKPNLMSPHAVTTPGATGTPKQLLPAKPLRADNLGESPQIGTSLLRRESLRRKESPSKKKDAGKNKTPKKRDTLQRRDTLQEREILQKIIAETNAYHSDENLDARPIEASILPSSSSAPGAEDNVGDNVHGSPEPILRAEQPDNDIVTGAEAILPAIDETNVEKDLHRAIEAIEVYEHPGIADASQPLLDLTPDDTQGMEAMEKANEVLAKTELDGVSQVMEATKKQTPNQKTRSGARFSDDTSMLKDFLNRAQARKAAQKPILSAPAAPIPQHSPRRSPRKTHGSQDGHASSPQKPRNVAHRPGTPPGTPKMEALDSDDGEELTAEPASCRRSTRTRLPAPSKALPGAPSFIPVRRADGTDPVVLQKSQAQDLAVSTRANTRRNKGQSKPPLLALQDLPTERADLTSTAKQGAENGKSVAWAERLASYQDAKGEADDAEERRPKVRRLRGLGAVNGTLAAKRTTAVVSTSNGTPAPKGRGKV